MPRPAAPAAEPFEERRLTTQHAFEASERLIAELREDEGRMEANELSPEVFAVYRMLKKEGAKDPQPAARQAEKAFAGFPH